MMDVGELPVELTCIPKQLVFTTGLDVVNSPVHKAVFDALQLNRNNNERPPLLIKNIGADHVFPKAVNKHASYENYVPRGLLKCNWMRKHLEEIPAVVVLFVDLDWNHPSWNQKMTEVQSKVESLRSSLEGRNTRIAIVLIQSVAPLPTGVDMVSAERAKNLCQACNISPTSLYVLPHHLDHLQGYVNRLEQAFSDLGQSYYQGEIKRVKTKKDTLNKAIHQSLLIRTQFKLGFYSELKQESHIALRHYKLAYQHLSEAPHPNPILWLEWKVAAGFVNYKICRISFYHNTPIDAITQFRRHSDFFRDKIGPANDGISPILHSSWMAKQYSSFGELFDLAVQRGLAAIQIQHPGFYFQYASDHAIKRRQLVDQERLALSSAPGMAYPDPDPFASTSVSPTEFYGQYPWRVGSLPTEIQLDSPQERTGALALRFLESRKDVSSCVLDLLNLSVVQFKKYRSPRMRRRLLVQMGEEYMVLRDYGKAYKLLTQAIWEFRSERCPLILHHIHARALDCAFALATVKDYVALGLELIGPASRLKSDERARVQINLSKVLNGQAPDAEGSLPPETIGAAAEAWTRNLSERSFFILEMKNGSPAVQCRAWFTSGEAHADGHVVVRAAINVQCPYPIRFTKLAVNYGASTPEIAASYTTKSTVENSERLNLEPGKLSLFEFAFIPAREDVGKDLQITGLSLSLGEVTSKVFGTLEWSAVGSFTGPCPSDFAGAHPRISLFDYSSAKTAIKILPRVSQVKLSVEHPSVILKDDQVGFRLKLVNGETKPGRHLRIVCKSEPSQTQPPAATQSAAPGQKPQSSNPNPAQSKPPIAFLNPDGSEAIDQITMNAADLIPGSQTQEFEIKANVKETGPAVLHFQVYYNIESGSHDCECCTTKTVSVEVVQPFSFNNRILSLFMEECDVCLTGESYNYKMELAAITPVEIEMESMTWHLNGDYVRETGTFELPQPCRVSENDRINGLVQFRVNENAASSSSNNQLPVCPGSVTLKWRRVDSNESELSPPHSSRSRSPTTGESNTSHLSLRPFSVKDSLLSLAVGLPAYGFVRNPLPIRYELTNRSEAVLHLELTMNTNESFMFAGNRKVTFRLLPGMSEAVEYVLFPLVCGQVALPQLKLTSNSLVTNPSELTQQHLDYIVGLLSPTSVYVFVSSCPNSLSAFVS